MKTSQRLFSSALRPEDWVYTKLVSNGRKYACGSLGNGIFRETEVVDAEYPGFSSAFNMLLNIGCDPREITSILKVCITMRDKQTMDAFLTESITLSTVKTALALGLSGDEFVAALLLDAAAKVSPEVPPDMAFTQ